MWNESMVREEGGGREREGEREKNEKKQLKAPNSLIRY